jgi:hypothetical protein
MSCLKIVMVAIRVLLVTKEIREILVQLAQPEHLELKACQALPETLVTITSELQVPQAKMEIQALKALQEQRATKGKVSHNQVTLAIQVQRDRSGLPVLQAPWEYAVCLVRMGRRAAEDTLVTTRHAQIMVARV